MSLSTASAPELRRFLAVVKYCVLSLTPPSGERSYSTTSVSIYLTEMFHNKMTFLHFHFMRISLWMQISMSVITRIKDIRPGQDKKSVKHNFFSIFKLLQILDTS
jgi:hypothetical protein